MRTREASRVEPPPPLTQCQFEAWLTAAVANGDVGGLLAAVESRRVNVATDCRWPDQRALEGDQRARAREAAIEQVIGLGGEWAAPDGTTWTARPGWLARRVDYGETGAGRP